MKGLVALATAVSALADAVTRAIPITQGPTAEDEAQVETITAQVQDNADRLNAAVDAYNAAQGTTTTTGAGAGSPSTASTGTEGTTVAPAPVPAAGEATAGQDAAPAADTATATPAAPVMAAHVQ